MFSRMPINQNTSTAVLLKFDKWERCLKVWDSGTRKLEKIYKWDSTLPLSPGEFLKLSDDLVILEKLRPLFQSRIRKDKLQIRVPYTEVYAWHQLCNAQQHNFVGYSPILGPVGRFFHMDFKPDRIYWVWACKIPDNKLFEMCKSQCNMGDDVQWMIEKVENEEDLEEVQIEDLENASWIKKVDGVIVGSQNDFSFAWNENQGLCAIFSRRRLELGRWVSFYALNLPLYQNVIGVYWSFIKQNGYPRFYGGEQLEVKFYVPESTTEDAYYYRAPKIGYVFDEHGGVTPDMGGSFVTGVVEFDESEEKWKLNEVLGFEPAVVGVVCLMDGSNVYLYAESLEEPPNRTIELSSSIFSTAPELGRFYALVYDEEAGAPCATVEAEPKFDVRLKGNTPFLMVKTWVQLRDYRLDCIRGYSKELDIDVYDNSKRFKRLYRGAWFHVDVVYRDDPLFGFGWKIHQYTKIYDIKDPYNTGC